MQQFQYQTPSVSDTREGRFRRNRGPWGGCAGQAALFAVLLIALVCVIFVCN